MITSAYQAIRTTSSSSNQSESYACGLGDDFEFTVTLDPASIQRINLLQAVNLNDEEWVYGFLDTSLADCRLRLRFSTPDGSSLVGHAVEVDANGRWIGNPIALGVVEGKLVYECERPLEGSEPAILLFFAAAEPVSSTSLPTASTKRPSGPPPGTPPFGLPVDAQISLPSSPSAQPKLTLKPKRNCPTTGTSGPTSPD